MSILEELLVGVDPRCVSIDNQRKIAYISNRGSDSISIVDLEKRTVISEVEVGNKPYGVVVSPDGETLYIAEQGSDRLSILDTKSLEITAQLDIEDRPSGLAILNDGSGLYITHLLKPLITVIDLSSTSISRSLENSFHTDYFELWPDSNLVQSLVVAPDQSEIFIPHTRSNSTNRALTFDTTVFPVVTPIDLSTGQINIHANITLDTADQPVGLPSDLAFTSDGEQIWVVNAASNDVSVIDLNTGTGVAHIEVGDNPRGIILSSDDNTAYVNNTLAGTISVIDTATYIVTATIPVTRIPLPPLLLEGKKLFHTSDDPRLSKDQWIACNTCHFEGEHDGRTWFFGFAGPRNTTGLFGMIETYPLRWSGEWDESADSEFANRKENFGSGLIDGEMNCSLNPADCVNHLPNQGRSYDLDALAAFMDSLEIPLSPAHTRGEPLTTAEQRGQVLYNDPKLGCVECHPPPLYTDLIKHDVGTVTADEKIGSTFDTPTLLALYDSSPYFHDGSIATLYEALTYPSPESEHNLSNLLSETEIQELIAFLLALPFDN
jgi:YVTN family beta-propeller protein